MNGPAISDYNKRLIQLSVIQLSGGHCMYFLHFTMFMPDDLFKKVTKIWGINFRDRQSTLVPENNFQLVKRTKSHDVQVKHLAE